jgi:hypothetical protein
LYLTNKHNLNSNCPILEATQKRQHLTDLRHLKFCIVCYFRFHIFHSRITSNIWYFKLRSCKLVKIVITLSTSWYFFQNLQNVIFELKKGSMKPQSSICPCRLLHQYRNTIAIIHLVL